MTWAKGRFPALPAQSVQQIVMDFCDAISTTTAARKAARADGRDPTEIKYPWRTPRYREIVYTNQTATIRDSTLLLSMPSPDGKNGGSGPGRRPSPLRVRLPAGIVLPGRLMEVRLAYGKVTLVCKLDEDGPLAFPVETPVVGIDLGVNTLLAATDGERAVLVSGREAKATVQWKEKRCASLKSAQSRKRKGHGPTPPSRRYKRLQRRRYAVQEKAANRLKDITHKATHAVVDAFPGARVVVGKPFNAAARKMGPVQAQQVAVVPTGQIITQLDYKVAAGVTEVNEAYSSQTCPVCGCRNKCRRIYRCQGCGFTAPRDVVGSANIRCIGRTGGMVPDPDFQAPRTRFIRPLKYPGRRSPPKGDIARPGSSGGLPAGSSP